MQGKEGWQLSLRPGVLTIKYTHVNGGLVGELKHGRAVSEVFEEWFSRHDRKDVKVVAAAFLCIQKVTNWDPGAKEGNIALMLWASDGAFGQLFGLSQQRLQGRGALGVALSQSRMLGSSVCLWCWLHLVGPKCKM